MADRAAAATTAPGGGVSLWNSIQAAAAKEKAAAAAAAAAEAARKRKEIELAAATAAADREAKEKKNRTANEGVDAAAADDENDENNAPTTTSTKPKPQPAELPLASFYSRKRPAEFKDTEARVAKLLAAVDARLGGVVAAANKFRGRKKRKKRRANGDGNEETDDEDEEEQQEHLGFRVFRRQQEAFDAADAAGPHSGLRVFSVELGGASSFGGGGGGGGSTGNGSNGSSVNRSTTDARQSRRTWRAYIAATLPEFWSKYRRLPSDGRHHYEVLREGKPCHLYLDIEFKRRLNSSGGGDAVDGDAVVDGCVEAIRRVLRRRFGGRGRGSGSGDEDGGTVFFDDADVLELDSSSDDKFSRHVTIRLSSRPGGGRPRVPAAFATTADAGAIVREAVYSGGEGAGSNADDAPSSSQRALLPPPLPQPTLADFARVVVSEDGSQGSAVDLGVYTRNRAWRMALSSKASAPARVLRPLARRYGGFFCRNSDGKNKNDDDDGGKDHPISDRAAFFCGLAGEVPQGCSLLSVEGAEYGGGGGPPQNGKGTVSCSPLPSSSVAGFETRTTSSSSSSLRARPGPSPFPAVDAFIEGIATSLTADGRQATVRSWGVATEEAPTSSSSSSSSFSQQQPTATLVLSLRDGRYCGGVGRPHRSNGVFYVVDLRGGTYRQRCHDPECRGYRSPAAPLPADVARAAAAAAATTLSSRTEGSRPGGAGGRAVAERGLHLGTTGRDDGEEATRRFLAALDAAEAVALEERLELRQAPATTAAALAFGDEPEEGDEDDEAALFAAVDAAVAEAERRKQQQQQEM